MNATLTQFDHGPPLLTMRRNVPIFPSFKFQKMRVQHQNCKRLVAETWVAQVIVCPIFVVGFKLKILKLAFKNGTMRSLGSFILR